MDFFGVSREITRSHAYKKLAQLSISSTSEESDISGKQSLLSQIGKGSSGLSNVAISLNEYEILVALCEGTRQGTVSASKAQLLTQKFRQYLLELPQQQFSEHVFTFLGDLPPWLSLAEKVTAALVDLTLVSHGFLVTEVLDTFMAFVESLFGTCNLELSSYLALLGFMKALTKNPSIFTANESSLKLFQLLDSSIDSVDFLTSAEYYSAYLASYP
ncbi:hypothetical protein HF325_004774 [Metschnikowia pulcherrima]|uniref:Uncharacterized protein n=1 Tax=Metschnikowia pulcherrima TaxID=27326 RepID=A0A8H7GPY9_9ASCO|nr:hypothetical protein HF325_004774 [Metschnikowia pulcherrima]